MSAPGVGLTVFGPEVAKSGLTNALHEFIRMHTRLQMAECFVVLHTRRSIEAFYQLTGSTGGAHWGIVESLFDLRPACVTLWSGDSALEQLQQIKGATQPAEAKPGTVRSLFWCDNPVTNLIHVSDSDEIMESELQILRSAAVGNDLTAWHRAATHRFAHSALWTLNAALAHRIGSSWSSSGLPASGDARLSAQLLWHQAEQLARRCGQEETVQGYLSGSEDALRQLLEEDAQASSWERMILACGLYSAKVWARQMAVDDRPEQELVACR